LWYSLWVENDSGEDLLDINKAPFSVLIKEEAKPNAEMLKEEVTRRHHSTHPQGGRKSPRPKNWTVDQLYKWLGDHPIQMEADVSFLRLTVDHHHQASLSAHRERKRAKYTCFKLG
jgi:uncharacterized protein (DUF305 family)